MISIFYVALGVLALAALSSSAYGRAGGGGHFSGSGHSSGGGFHSGGGYSFGGGGSHGGSGGGSASPTSLVVVLAVISIVVIIIVIQNQQADRTVRRGRTAANTSLAARLAVQLKAADPAFEADRFYGRVSDALLKVQTAWSTQVLAPMQPFAADGVLERFGLQIREQQALDYRDRMEQVRVARVLLARIVQGDVFETATLRIDASAVDYEQSLSSGQRVGGVTTSQPFTEFWTFIRRRGAATLRGAGLIEGRCPNCGGDISINQNAACAHCGALLRSGQFDWVLCEITQESEWRPQQPQEVAGYDAMHRLDPGLSTDDLEDRASVIFWRRAEAERTDTPAALKKVALDTFTDGWLAQRKVARVNQTHRWFGEIGVGAVDTVELVPGADFDRAVIKITWTGTRFSQAPDQPARRGGETSVMREIFVLCRRNGVRSDPDRGISSAHCPSCGAPVSDGLADACHQCGTVLNDGSIGWVLERVGSGGGVFIASLISKTLPIPLEDAADVGARSPHPPSASGLVIWAISMGLADGNIDAREERRIRTFAQRARMGGNEVAALIAAAQAGRLDSPMPRPGEETKAWLAAMIDVALADGRLGNREATLLKSLAGKCGMSDADVRLMIKQRQAALRAAARHASRGD